MMNVNLGLDDRHQPSSKDLASQLELLVDHLSDAGRAGKPDSSASVCFERAGEGKWILDRVVPHARS